MLGLCLNCVVETSRQLRPICHVPMVCEASVKTPSHTSRLLLPECGRGAHEEALSHTAVPLHRAICVVPKMFEMFGRPRSSSPQSLLPARLFRLQPQWLPAHMAHKVLSKRAAAHAASFPPSFWITMTDGHLRVSGLNIGSNKASQKWDPNWDRNWNSKVGPKNGAQKWDPKVGPQKGAKNGTLKNTE